MGERLYSSAKQLSNLQVRLMTTIVLLPIALIASILGDVFFLLALLPVMCVGMLEFYLMEKNTTMQGSTITGLFAGVLVVIAFYLHTEWLWQATLIGCIVFIGILEFSRQPKQSYHTLVQVGVTLCGLLYIAFPTAFLVAIRNIPSDGFMWLLIVFAITWGTDTFAYIFGRLFGKTKLAPLISPNKTVEGALGGILGAWVPALLILLIAGKLNIIIAPMIIIGPFLAVTGDLFESALKRFFKVKDSYIEGLNIFPGHGGVLDRIDALVWVATWVFLYLYIVGIV